MLDDAQSAFNNSRSASWVDWDKIKTEHLVQWYDNDRLLFQSVGAFISNALTKSEAAIVIATQAHRMALVRWLEAAGLDPLELQRRGRYIPLDASDTLALFMVNGRPDAKKFRDVVGSIVSRASASWGGIRAFGEMVALLWEEGNKAGAIELEHMWNDLAKTYSFSLFCAYPKKAFKTFAEREAVADVCGAHSMVLL